MLAIDCVEFDEVCAQAVPQSNASRTHNPQTFFKIVIMSLIPCN